MKQVTMADVAQKAGVSKSTVSQFLNGRFEYMSKETKEKIKQAIAELSYQPNALARSLKQKRTSMIGIIVANIMHGISTEVSQAIEDFCHKRDVQAIVCNAYDDPEKEKKYIEMLRAKQVDGLIIFPSGGNEALYEQMVQDKYPVVFVDRKIDHLNVNTVVVNNQKAVEQAVMHLLERQHRDIAIVTPPMTTSTRKERIEGYKAALKAKGLPVQQQFILSAPIAQIGEDLQKMFQEKPPTAVVAANDLSFMEVMKFAKNKRLKIGVDLAVVVFDNIAFADIYEPPITVISQPAYQMGTKAAELLIKQITKEPIEPSLHVLDATLIVRESSSQPWL